MIEYWRKFWAELMTPSNNIDDPYAEGAGQLGHMALGCIFSIVICLIWFAWRGEMPVRLHVWAAVIVLYAFIIEGLQQGWRRRDSLADTFFVQCGATMTLWPVREVGIDSHMVILQFKPTLLAALMFMSGAALALHLWPRIKNRFGGDGDV